MKKYLMLIIVAVFFCSCNSLPEPGASDDVLIVGNLLIDYPDGFFEKPSRVIRSNVKIKIINSKNREETTLTTRNGFFHFVGKKGDEYLLSHYEYKCKEDDGLYSVGGWLKKGFCVIDNNINYLGHIKMVNTAGDKISQIGSDKYYSYKESFTLKVEKDEVLEYYNNNYPDSAWLDNDIKYIEMTSFK